MVENNFFDNIMVENMLSQPQGCGFESCYHPRNIEREKQFLPSEREVLTTIETFLALID